MIGIFDYCLCGNQGLLTFHKWLALQAKTEQIRHETQGIARLLPSFITQSEKVLVTAFQDKHIFCCYYVMCQSLRMTKFPISCLISAKKICVVANIDEVSTDPNSFCSIKYLKQRLKTVELLVKYRCTRCPNLENAD